MRVVSLDTIVRTVLLQRGYSIHWYLQCLLYGRDCLRELTFDDLRIINTQNLPVVTDNNVNYAYLPNDFNDFVMVGVPYGQNIRPLVQNNKINRLPHYASDFTPTSYGIPVSSSTNTLYYGANTPMFWRMNTFNEFGEPTGRFYGIGAGVETDTFTLIPERNIIQLNENLAATSIILQYISDGMDADSATNIEVYAQATIEAYIKWQLKENNRHYSDGERQVARQEYIGQRKILRARKNNLSIDDWKRIFQRTYYLAPK